ncbi:MAG: hypothetical protein IPM21_17340 [Acidobacteria bacterium]|nr:hypothetical protein [Acidobacteriota bacterium]
MDNPIVIGIVSWIFPGAGHFIQKKNRRGIIIAASIWIMFIIAIATGGAYYPGFEYRDGQLLYLLNAFAKLGNGLGAFISFLFSVTPSPDAAASATFEYGGRLLEAAGLLNFLAIVDALDIYYGRKK